MPVYPEKLGSRQETRGAIASQFWEQHVQSTRSIDGESHTLPCEPAPLAQTGPSGLNRAQQLLAAQAVLAPALPSYSAVDGGVVLDRVMARTGGKSWWATVSARARAQRMWKEHRSGKKSGHVLRDLNNYSLATRWRTAIGKRGTVNLLVEVPNVQELKESVEEGGVAKALASSAAQPLCKGQAVAKLQLPGHELQAMATRNQEYLDSAATYCTLPLALSLDLTSLPRADGIQYRAGFHQVKAPGQEAVHGAAMLGPSAGPSRLESSLHFQGAVAVEGEATLWKASNERDTWPQPRRAAKDPSNDMEEPEEAQIATSETASQPEDVVTEPIAPHHTASEEQGLHSRLSQDDRDASPASCSDNSLVKRASRQQTASGSSNDGDSGGEKWTWLRPVDWDGSDLLRGGWQEGRSPSWGGSEGSGTAQQTKSRGNLGLPQSDSTRKVGSQHQGGCQEAGVTFVPEVIPRGVTPLQGIQLWEPPEQHPNSLLAEWHKMMGSGPVLQGVEPAKIQSGLVTSRKAIDKVRVHVDAAIKQVRAGMQSYHRHAASRAGSAKPVRCPYSLLLAEPFVKVHGAVGCLARVPIPHHAFHLSHAHSALQSDREVDSASRTSSKGPGRWSQELWTPYLRDTALRVFASCGLSAQAGRFTKRFGDFTSASIRFDCGLTSPDSPPVPLPVVGVNGEDTRKPATPTHEQQAEQAGNRLFRHRAFALEGRGIWHAATVSFAQQIWGPLRARVDTRLALDTTVQVKPEGKSRLTLQSLAAGAPWLQPVMLETVYGLDLVIPGSQGSARACAWLSPTRREAMLELRLF